MDRGGCKAFVAELPRSGLEPQRRASNCIASDGSGGGSPHLLDVKTHGPLLRRALGNELVACPLVLARQACSPVASFTPQLRRFLSSGGKTIAITSQSLIDESYSPYGSTKSRCRRRRARGKRARQLLGRPVYLLPAVVAEIVPTVAFVTGS